ncbi:MAG: hypothetical protein QOK05_2083 [Chloroflexota bacterium]|nr:hypothetical protein [Chloroflexota bacterium]
MTEAAIELVDVRKSFKIYQKRHTTLKEVVMRGGRSSYEVLPVLDDVSLTIPKGQSLGIVGRNGAGKSTMLKVISGLMPPDEGRVTVRGRVSSMLELGAGFQTEYTGAENIYLYGALMGLSRDYLRSRFDDIVEFAGDQVSRHLDNAVKTYSSGMYMRLAFAVAVHVDPEVLIVDEVLSVGDEAFQKKCLERTAELRAAGKTIVLVSHDAGAVKRFCDRAVWIEGGKVRADGRPDDVLWRYQSSMASGDVEAAARAPERRPAVEIEEIHVEDGNGRAQETVRSREPATVRFTMTTTAEATVNVTVGVRWINADGVVVMAASQHRGMEAGIGRGRSTWACAFADVALAPGTYRLEIAVHDTVDGSAINPPHPQLKINVLGEPSEGLVPVQATWTEPSYGVGARALTSHRPGAG